MRKKRTQPPAKPAGAELARLRARLEEAEQTLDAIRSGTVDALVVAGPQGDRVFTLEGADYRYRRLIETMKEGAAIVGADGSIVFANDRLAEMLGMALPRLLASKIEAYVAAGSRGTLHALMREGIQRPSKAEVRFARANMIVPTYVSATPTGDDDGGVCLVVTDLTEQKRSEEILAAERLATSILEQAAEAVIVCSLDGRIVRASRAAHRLAGSNPLFRPFGDVFPIQLPEASHRDLLALVFAGELVSGAQGTLADASRVTKHLVVSAAPLANAKQEIFGCVVSLTDVTERKRAEDGMQLLGRASAALGGSFDIEAMIDGLVSVVVPSFATICVVYTFGDDRRNLDLVGVAHADPARTFDLRAELASAARRTGGSFVETALISGTPRRIDRLADVADDPFVVALRGVDARSVMVAPLRAHRRTLGVILVARTGSEESFRSESAELLEELAIRAAVAIDNSKLFDLAQREKLRVEEANRAKDEFLATVSHELRTPLNAILGWARILRSREIPEDKRERALETIERNAVIQAQLIDDLLDISRIVSGKIRLEPRDVQIASVVQAAIDSVKPIAQAKNVMLQGSLDAKAGPVVGDADRLQQVVWNLLTNAVKFTAAGGHVNVVLRAIHSHVEIDVTDDGRGISSEFLPHVFERFRQADGGSTRAHGGLGIGLTIVKKLVELHGGTIEAHSPGENLGSTFLVKIPCAETKADVSHVANASSLAFVRNEDLAGTHLLVVDDDSDGRELVAEVLRECKADVKIADSAAAAFDAIQREPFDALLSDIGMPVEDGYSLIARVRALPADKNGRVPALALTAFARAEDRRRALLAGFDGHIPKPVEPHELVVVLSSLIRRACAHDGAAVSHLPENTVPAGNLGTR